MKFGNVDGVERVVLSSIFVGVFVFGFVSCDRAKDIGEGDPSEISERLDTHDHKEGGRQVIESDTPDLDRLEKWGEKGDLTNELEEIDLMKHAVQRAVADPKGVLVLLEKAPHSPRRLPTVRVVMAGWAKSDLEAAKRYADGIEDERLRAVARLAVISNYPGSRVEESKGWIATWPTDAEESKQASEVVDRRLNPDAPHACGPECDIH